MSRRGGYEQPRGLRLVRRTLTAAAPPALDEDQARAVAHRGGPLRVLGAPGTGKTLVAVEHVVARVAEGLDPSAVLLLAPARLAAADLRERVTARLARTVREPLARTPHSFAFGVLRQAAALDGRPAPRLLNGPEQDVVLRELLAGHTHGEGRAPTWPQDVLPALGTRGMRAELRDLLMRAVERGVDDEGLAALGRAHDRPEWVAGADLLREYDEVTALSTPGAFDPAAIVDTAAAVLDEDPDLLGRVRAQARVIVVDDAHELTPAALHLLEVLAGGGGELVLLADPDATTQSFRGADPSLLSLEALRAFPRPGTTLPTVVLRTSWRQGPALRDLTATVARRIGAVAGTTHREVTYPEVTHPDAPGEVADERGTPAYPPVSVAVLPSTVREAAYVAHLLRREHLERGRPWSDLAVVVRGTSRAASLRRVLAAEGVPVEVPAAEQPVRDHAAVAPLLLAYRVALELGEYDGPPEEGEAPECLDPTTAVELLTSPLGGADAVALRRLRRALRTHELSGGGSRSSDELLVDALVRPDDLATLDRATTAPARRVAAVLAAGAAAVRAGREPVPEAEREGRAPTRGVTAETVLWELWQASGLAQPWQRTALAGGQAGARADRDLDAVVALFDAAARFVDRLPELGPREFLEHLLAQEVAGDTLAERSPSEGAVSLLTPQGTAGRQWPVVVVAGVQEGVWPDLRLRGSLLGSQDLVDVVSGRGGSTRAAQAAVRHDELRMFHVALSRAGERVVVTAVQDEDQQPSQFVDLVRDHLEREEPARGEGGAGADATAEPAATSDLVVTVESADQPPSAGRTEGDAGRDGSPLSLPALVAELRRMVCAPGAADDPRAQDAAHVLAELARAGVPGADPAQWYGLAPLSDDGPLAGPDQDVRLSPSTVEGVERCSLRWLLEQAGGRGGSSVVQGVGTLVHDIAATHPRGTAEELAAELDRRWPGLRLPDGWVADALRERAESMVTKLAAYVEQTIADGWEPVDVERAFDVPLDLVEAPRPVRVAGRVDRLEQDRDGRLRVVDLKTGKSKPKAAEVDQHAQLGAYQVAVEHGAFPDRGTAGGGAVLVQLGTTTKGHDVQVQAPPQDSADPAWARQLLARVAEVAAGATFPAAENQYCVMCPVRTSCPVQTEGRTVTE